ncbi:MAG: hypothetical protein HY760_03795 [Nitrospirae bacterium]|nr:hypothetical protein [Nitrospirota bacterium]
MNGNVPWEDYLDRPGIRDSYDKACLWSGHFKTMIEGHIRRGPLPVKPGEIDPREYRKFQEALSFVSDRT